MKDMLITKELRAAAQRCYEMSFPFAISLMPHSDEPQFFACDKAVCPHSGLDDYFLTGSFGEGVSQLPLAILPQFSPDEIFAFNLHSPIACKKPIEAKSTGRSEYDDIIRNVVNDLTGLDAKVVIARQIVVETDANPFDVAERYFQEFPACMRSIYYTPQTGLWITATPELLIDYNADSEKLHTMSLAGTRRCGESEWDIKNSREHALVTEYIASVLEDFGMDVSISEAESLPFGKIEHLCNRITAFGIINPVELALRLSPTPAVGGWPVDAALKSIRHYENFDRGCYGGFLGIVTSKRCRLFVNLRCGQLVDSNEGKFTWRLFAGGGITNMSHADVEWAETENKIKPLKNILTEKILSLTY